MSRSCESRRGRAIAASVLAGLLLWGVWGGASAAARAGGPPFGIPSGVLPPDYYKYARGYSEPPRGPTAAGARAGVAPATPAKYTVQVIRVPVRHTAPDPNLAVVMAHVPEDAEIWFGNHPTSQRGEVRYFTSPPLQAGKGYSYDVRIGWYEDGQWVAQTINVPVAPGEVRCAYIVKADKAQELAEVAKNLEKLSLEDHRQALLQKVCAVQGENSLGSMGVPVKLVIKGQPVFLCCKGCEKQALANPDKTLARVKELTALPSQAESPHR